MQHTRGGDDFMIEHPVRSGSRVTVWLLAILLAAGVLTGTAVAASFRGSFDETDAIINPGNAVTVAGTIGCPNGDTVSVRATITQVYSSTVAEGTWSANCTGKTQRWTATATVTDGATLDPGCGQGAGLSIVSHDGTPVKVRQWFNGYLELHYPHKGIVTCLRRL
jgi:hypothetical protein